MAGIEDKNLFMMCEALNPAALTQLSPAYYVRTCRTDELAVWKAMPFDSPELANEFAASMTQYFDEVYANQESEFFTRCLFVCDRRDTPIATCFGWTCFGWKAYGHVSTIQWLKVSKRYEGLGIGRALLSIVMKIFGDRDYPIFLHTQPGSFRAIKLYSDFGFVLLTDATIGYRQNELADALPYLQAHMFPDAFHRLRFARAPNEFLEAVKSSPINQF